VLSEAGKSRLRLRKRVKAKRFSSDTSLMGDSAADQLERQTTVNGVLQTLCIELTKKVPADGCALSRVIGLLLVEIADHAGDGNRLGLGRGYLLPDYPVTQEVIEQREPRTVSVHDAGADPGEVALLRELSFDLLLMMPLELDGRCWGLVEIYRAGSHAFEEHDIAIARDIVARASDALERVQRRAADAAA
jgi:GAF domain-containing protein